MAQRTQVILIDDIDGGEADETVTFALDGVTYEIDLSSEHASTLRADLSSWVGHARRQSNRRPTSSSSSTSSRRPSRSDLAEVRDWGRANGFSVSERGRVSAALQDAYAKAH